MKRFLQTLCLGSACLACASAQVLLFEDNFDTADTTNFDTAPLTGRLSGTASGETNLESFGASTHEIFDNQLSLITTPFPSGGVRFGGQTSRYDWAGATTGPDILAGEGFKVSFDWTHDGTSGEWIGFKVGTANNDVFINDASVDYGILIRGNGANERFDNGGGLGNSGISYNPVGGVDTTYPVEMTFSFASFADGSAVNVKTVVNGVEIADDNFNWDGNSGAIHLDLHTFDNGFLIDDFAITALEPPVYGVSLTGTEFKSGAMIGDAVGTLGGMIGVNPVASTFALVSGDGDDDNGLFDIDGDELVVNSDFTGANSTDGQQFSVRVEGTSTEGGGETGEASFVLTVSKDDDLDDLPDAWELQWTDPPNLTDLGAYDFDGDLLLDLEEYQISIGAFAGFPAYPDIDPTEADTDGDGVLTDGDEIFPSSFRPETDPTKLDTDDDGLSDVAETNTGTFVDANDTGTDPTDPDYDNDGSRDGWELANVDGAAMFDDTVFPASVSPSVTVTQITDDASSGISSTKVYTHKISGGGAATVNGVSFDVLTDTITPADFSWSTDSDVKAVIAPINNNGWVPANGGVTGPGLLDLLGGLVWSSNGGATGTMQTYTLSGLTPGEDYILRLYIRRWDAGGAGRTIDLTFTNGAEVVTPYGALPTDRPDIVLGTGNADNAYYVSYSYTAQGTELVIDAVNDPAFNEVWSSFHLYGLTNEVEGAVAAVPPSITAVSRDSVSGDVTIDFEGAPNTSYSVTKSPDLETAFGPLASPLSPATDGAGVGQVTVPAIEFGGASSYFLRLEE